MTCARCGAQNPDGNQFCQACGTPLTAGAAAAPAPPPAVDPAAPSWLASPPPAPPPSAPPAAYAAPAPAPAAYASPYYSPAGAMPMAPVHRTPWFLILSAVGALIVLMAGCGTALALLHGNITFSGGITPDQPTPAGSPSPVASPTALSGPTASNAVVTIPVPAGWAVSAKDNESITLSDPNGLGFVSVASGVQSPSLTVQQQKSAVDAALKSKYPDTVQCGGLKATTGSLGGVKGLFWNLCFTLVSNGRSLPAEASMFVGTNADGSVWYGVILLTAQTYMQNLTSESAPILAGIQWKLK